MVSLPAGITSYDQLSACLAKLITKLACKQFVLSQIGKFVGGDFNFTFKSMFANRRPTKHALNYVFQ